MPADLLQRLRMMPAGPDEAHRVACEAAREIERLQQLAQALRLGMVSAVAVATYATGGRVPSDAWRVYGERVSRMAPEGLSPRELLEAAIAADTPPVTVGQVATAAHAGAFEASDLAALQPGATTLGPL